MKIERILYMPARDEDAMDNYEQFYRDREGLHLIETKTYQYISDFSSGRSIRESEDNGKTWSEWRELPTEDVYETQGEVIRQPIKLANAWNPVHKHTVQLHGVVTLVGGEHEGGMAFWYGDGTRHANHGFIDITDEDGNTKRQQIKYEEGDEFDENDFIKRSFFFHNRLYPHGNIIIEPNGDILFPAEVPVRICCRIKGVDVEKIFPTKPDTMRGIIVFRGTWDGEKYTFTPCDPVIISDIHSSRGFNEPAMARLKSGRIILVIRGSNAYPFGPDTRIAPGTPAFKWFSFSDDNGKTFSDPMPWHFDNGEVIYSPATISYIHQDERTGKHYWIGNITGPEAFANNPRYPLCIVEIDEEYGFAKKDTFTVIDTRREGESEHLQLSNFFMLQNRETGNLEIMLNKLGQYSKTPGDNPFKAESWKYIIELN